LSTAFFASLPAFFPDDFAEHESSLPHPHEASAFGSSARAFKTVLSLSSPAAFPQSN